MRSGYVSAAYDRIVFETSILLTGMRSIVNRPSRAGEAPEEIAERDGTEGNVATDPRQEAGQGGVREEDGVAVAAQVGLGRVYSRDIRLSVPGGSGFR
jgi:hypothetical protein